MTVERGIDAEGEEGQEVVMEGFGGVKLVARNKEREGSEGWKGWEGSGFLSIHLFQKHVALIPPASWRRGRLMVPRNHIGPLVASHRIEPFADLIGGHC